MSNRLKPVIAKDETIGWSIQPVKLVLKFALTIAFTSSVWVLVTQTDKLILSGILPLAEYGFFTLAVLVASGIMILSSPVSTVIMPRMARLYAEGKEEEMIQVYRNATQLVSVIAGSASITLALFSETLLYIWTGDKEIAGKSSPILTLYALGNGVLAVSAFPYYLQYALGNLRYHLIGNFLIVLTLVPTIIWASLEYGGVGAGWAWLCVNSLYLVIWVGYVHLKLSPGMHRRWIIVDVLPIYLSAALVSILMARYVPVSENIFVNLFYLSISCVVVFLLAMVSSSVLRGKIFNWMRS